MKGEAKRMCEAGLVALALLGLLAGCAGEATHPLAPMEEGSYLREIRFLERSRVEPDLFGNEPYEVSFTVTPEEGGTGELDFVTFAVEPNNVKQDVTVTITAENPGYYLVELSTADGGKLKKGTLTFHVDAADLVGDSGSLAVYVETKHGWQQLAAEWSPDGSEMTVTTGKMSRYALSRE
jgi:hypothetical protein